MISKSLAIRVCLCVGVLGVHLLVGCASPQQKAARHLEQAEHWAATGKTNEAILEYRRAVQLDAKSPVAHLALAKIFMDRGDYPSAYREANTVHKNNPMNEKAQLMIAELYFKTGDFTEAQKQAQTLADRNLSDIGAWMIVAESAIALKDQRVARSSIDHVLQLDPRSSRGWHLRAMVQLLDRQKSESEASLEKAIEYGPDSIPPVTALAVSMVQQGDAKGAERVIRQALERNPQNIEAYKLLGAFLLAQARGGEAEEVFRKVAELGDNDPGNRGMLAHYYAYLGNDKAAMQAYQNILKKHPDDVQNALQLVSVYLQLGRNSEGEQLLLDIGKRKPNDPKVLLLLGRWRIAEGHTDEGIADMLHAARLDPQWALPQYFLGLAYIRGGKLDLAETALNSAVQLDPNLPAPRLILAQLALNAGKPEQAIANLEKTVESKPPFVEPYLLRALALAQQGQYAEMEHATLPLVDQFPQPPARAMTYRTLAWAKFHQGRFNDAHTFARESLKYEPASADGLYLLGASQIALKRVDLGLAEVQSLVLSNPSWAPGYATLGKLQAIGGHFADAEVSLRKASELDPGLTGAQLGLADVQLAQGKIDSAMEVLSTLARNHPNFAPAQVQMGQISERKQDWQSAERYYSKALAISPADVVAKNNLAWIYAEHGGNIDVALKLAQDAKEAAPDSPDVSDTLGWIMVKKQNYATAAQLLGDCVRKEPDNASFRYHLGVAYYYWGQKSEAKQSLQSALKLEPGFSDADNAKKILQTLEN